MLELKVAQLFPKLAKFVATFCKMVQKGARHLNYFLKKT